MPRLTEEEIQNMWENYSDGKVVKAGLQYLGTKFFEDTGINPKATRLTDENREMILESIEDNQR